MSLDIAGWLVGVIGALVAVIAVKSRNNVSRKVKETERRVNAINEARNIRENIERLDDDSVIDEFRRLHDDRRR